MEWRGGIWGLEYVCEVECGNMGVRHEGMEDGGKGLYRIGMGVCMEQGMKVWQLI